MAKLIGHRHESYIHIYVARKYIKQQSKTSAAKIKFDWFDGGICTHFRTILLFRNCRVIRALRESFSSSYLKLDSEINARFLLYGHGNQFFFHYIVLA